MVRQSYLYFADQATEKRFAFCRRPPGELRLEEKCSKELSISVAIWSAALFKLSLLTFTGADGLSHPSVGRR